MKRLLLLTVILCSLICVGQEHKGKPSFLYAGIANFPVDSKGTASVGLDVGYNWSGVYMGASSNAVFKSDNYFDLSSLNIGYTLSFLDEKFAFIPTIGLANVKTPEDNQNKFNTGLLMQGQLYKQLYLYGGIGKWDGYKIGIALKVN